MNQTFTSKNTSINSKKLPRVYNVFPLNDCKVIDYGCGRYTDHIQNWAKEHNIQWFGYDKYNQTEANNEIALEQLNDADYVICSNVLNVIKEDEILKEIIDDCVRPGSAAIFTVYEGDKTGIGRATGKDQYQRNCKRKWYEDLMKEMGYDVLVKNNMIMAYVPFVS